MKKLYMASIDYEKAFDNVLHSWVKSQHN